MSALRATMRLQFHRDFTLDDACGLVEYFHEMGISHLYASPLLKSRSGSSHGYDGVDPTCIDPELGGEAALGRLVERLHACDMGLIMDIVPNHLAVDRENPWWQDVLCFGEQSEQAHYFDIDWQVPDPALHGRMLLPFLGTPYDEALHSGELSVGVEADSGRFHVDYFDNRFPLAFHSLGPLLRASRTSALEALADAVEALPREALAAEQARASAEDIRTLLIQALTDRDVRQALEQALAGFDGRTSEGAERLHALLEDQWYRLAWWRTGNDAINWRRFFDISELAGVRVELPDVFDAVHEKVFALIERGWVDGVRLDHIDGLVDPAGYCRKLRERLDRLAERRPTTTRATAPERLPILVEKILAEDEQLHDDWGVDGDTGYAFMNAVNALQHDVRGHGALATLWQSLSGRSADFDTEVVRARRLMLNTVLASEFDGAVRALAAVARSQTESRDITAGMIRRALHELIARFGVYRTYADVHGRPAMDEPHFQAALVRARPHIDPPGQQVLDALERWLGGEVPGAFDEAVCSARLRAITRFQQLTSPVAAKAVEDTAGYRSAVLLSRNDVGFEASTFALSVDTLHEGNGERQRRFPRAMLTTATHDHKRGEDVRARLAALSEWGDEYAAQVRQWFTLAGDLRGDSDVDTDALSTERREAPTPGDEMILYQILVGAWPLDLAPDDSGGLQVFCERIADWQQKALREAKLASHWLHPDEAYEQACRTFTRRLLTAPEGERLRHSIHAFVMRIAPAGVINGLTQTLLKLTSPGVPDLYQGTERWDFSLVDPDNRRPVDFDARRQALAALPLGELTAHWRDGRIKQALIRETLTLRRAYPRLFSEGDYQPLSVEGERAGQVVAFRRQLNEQQVIVVAARHVGALLADDDSLAVTGWSETRLQLPAAHANPASGVLKDVLTGRRITLNDNAALPEGSAAYQAAALDELLAELPLCLLVPEGMSPAS